MCWGPSQVLKQIPQNQAPVTITLAKKKTSKYWTHFFNTPQRNVGM